MSTIYLDPAHMEATARAVGEHAREAESVVAGLESACSAIVPPQLAGWLADELHDIAVHVRMAALVYTMAALDTALRAQEIQADQSLVTAAPALPGTTTAFTAAAPPVVEGFVLGAVGPAPTYPSTGWTGAGPFFGATPGSLTAFHTTTQDGLTSEAFAAQNHLWGTPAAGVGTGGDIGGYHNTNRFLLSGDGRTHVRGNIYEGSGMTGSFSYVLPDPGHDE